MKPTTFPEVTVTWAKDQPPYLPLPAYTVDVAFMAEELKVPEA